MVEILLKAGLPFGTELKDRGLDARAPEAARCLRGLRANSLRKRVSDWAPFSRWLAGTHGKNFPTGQDDILGYFLVRQAEGAPRTAYQSLLDALAFLETAGEVKAADCLHKLPALTGAAKEATTQKARDQQRDGNGPTQRQAPPLLIALVVAFEAAVGDEQRPVFERCYAWYRLLRHWASLRFDDTAGLPPQTLELRTRGLVGVLHRTKTSGADKSMSCLPIFVAKEAYVHEEWLEKGLDLWRKHLGYARDYLLCLPTQDLGGTIRKRARYADAQCFSKSLLSSLRAPGGYGRLLCAEAVPFWSEYSDRAGVDSWLAAVGVGSDHRRFLGRWAAGGAQDSYVRTALRICEILQTVAAKHARAMASGGPDYFGEEHLLAQLKAFLVTKGIGEAEAKLQTQLLHCADYEKWPTPIATISQEGQLEMHLEEGSAGDGVPVEEADWDAEPHEPQISAADLRVAAADLEPDELPTPQGFVISITRGSRFRRLHFAGGWWRKPGEHYKNFVDCGQRCPSPHEVDARCVDCFPADKMEAKDPDEGSASATSSSSSSSSS